MKSESGIVATRENPTEMKVLKTKRRIHRRGRTIHKGGGKYHEGGRKATKKVERMKEIVVHKVGGEKNQRCRIPTEPAKYKISKISS